MYGFKLSSDFVITPDLIYSTFVEVVDV
jgi:hypothetical protein